MISGFQCQLAPLTHGRPEEVSPKASPTKKDFADYQKETMAMFANKRMDEIKSANAHKFEIQFPDGKKPPRSILHDKRAKLESFSHSTNAGHLGNIMENAFRDYFFIKRNRYSDPNVTQPIFNSSETSYVYRSILVCLNTDFANQPLSEDDSRKHIFHRTSKLRRNKEDGFDNRVLRALNDTSKIPRILQGVADNLEICITTIQVTRNDNDTMNVVFYSPQFKQEDKYADYEIFLKIEDNAVIHPLILTNSKVWGTVLDEQVRKNRKEFGGKADDRTNGTSSNRVREALFEKRARAANEDSDDDAFNNEDSDDDDFNDEDSDDEDFSDEDFNDEDSDDEDFNDKLAKHRRDKHRNDKWNDEQRENETRRKEEQKAYREFEQRKANKEFEQRKHETLRKEEQQANGVEEQRKHEQQEKTQRKNCGTNNERTNSGRTKNGRMNFRR